MEYILTSWKDSFMTEPLATTLAGLLLFVSLRNHGSTPALRYFPYYFGLFIVHQLQLLALRQFDHPPAQPALFHLFSKGFGFLFILVEFIVFSRLCHQSLTQNRLRGICRYGTGLALGMLLLALLYTCCRSVAIYEPDLVLQRTTLLLHQAHLIESISLLLLAGLYWIDVYKRRPEKRLEKAYDFWMLTGCWVFAAVVIPPATAINIMPIQNQVLYNQLFALIYAGYLLMFLLILKGYTCTATSPN